MFLTLKRSAIISIYGFPDSGSSRTDWGNVAHDEIHLAIEGTQAPVVSRRLQEAP